MEGTSISACHVTMNLPLRVITFCEWLFSCLRFEFCRTLDRKIEWIRSNSLLDRVNRLFDKLTSFSREY